MLTSAYSGRTLPLSPQSSGGTTLFPKQGSPWSLTTSFSSLTLTSISSILDPYIVLYQLHRSSIHPPFHITVHSIICCCALGLLPSQISLHPGLSIGFGSILVSLKWQLRVNSLIYHSTESFFNPLQLSGCLLLLRLRNGGRRRDAASLAPAFIRPELRRYHVSHPPFPSSLHSQDKVIIIVPPFFAA